MQIHNMNILTRITEQNIFCMYNHVNQIIKNRGPGLCNYLRRADNRKYFSGLSLTQSQREAHMFHLVREVEKV